MSTGPDGPRAAFIEAACVPLDRAHVSGTLDAAEAILAVHPELAATDIYTAAIVGDDATVHRFLALDPGSATAASGPRGWDALTYLCFSRYLRLDRGRSEAFTRAARALLDAGASANTGFQAPGHQPPEFESALYGAAGVAHDAPLTRLLLERGANPNDGEVVYHTPEGYDNDALKVLVEDGRLTPESQTTILTRKTDWHDHEGIKWLLARGMDPNRMSRWGRTPLHQAVLRDNDLAIIETLLDHGADPVLLTEGRSALAIAARRGRGDVLESFARRGVDVALQGVDRLLAACARHDAAVIDAIVAGEPHTTRELVADGGRYLACFAGVGNEEGVRRLLDLGVPIGALFAEGDGYFDVARNSTALHVAAWRGQHATVRLLIARGAVIDSPDGDGRTPLALAVRACVDSHWAYRRSPESVEALLGAGASARGVDVPTGYAEIDALLRAKRGGG